MKKNKTFQLFFAVFIILVSACGKDTPSGDDNGNPDDPDGNNPPVVKVEEYIHAKWNVSGQNALYKSFEFTKDGKYIVEENDQTSGKRKRNSVIGRKKSRIVGTSSKKGTNKRASTDGDEDEGSLVHFGNYKIEGNRIILEGFGELEVKDITDNSSTVTLSKSGNTQEIKLSKIENTIKTSSNTSLLCRTWSIDKYEMDVTLLDDQDVEWYLENYGPNWKKLVVEEETAYYRAGDFSVLFTQAGTYFVRGKDGDGEYESDMSAWKWTNQQENAFYYSWENWSDDWTESIVKIIKLDNSTLIIQEDEDIHTLKLK